LVQAERPNAKVAITHGAIRVNFLSHPVNLADPSDDSGYIASFLSRKPEL
jgi:hypothetical protein